MRTPTTPTMREGQMHLLAGGGTFLLTALIVAPTLALGGGELAAAPPPRDMVVIEASLAYKAKPKSQPQKPMRVPVKEVVEGVATKPDVTPPPPDPDKKPDDVAPDKDWAKEFEKYRRDDNPDDQIGTPDDQPGSFDGSEEGFDQLTKGDPYFQQLKKDLLSGWEYPAILDDAGATVGCLHLAPDGKIPEIKLHTKSGIAELDDSVERQLDRIQALRATSPQPVPPHLLGSVMEWLCVKFDPKGS
ncbi:MAG: TonB C-terminal domain-containing protein [Kofleriaceae bacterium]